MDPITLILTALVSGAAAALKPTAEQAVKDAYAGLKTLLQRKFAGNPAAGVALTEYEKRPDVWKAPLEAEIKETGTDQDQEIIAAAKRLTQLAKELQGAKISTFQASSSGDYSPVTQTGDHSSVTQNFNQNQYFDKAGRDWNLRLIPASNLKLESFKLGDPTAATFSYVVTPVFDTVCQALRDASDETSKARRGLLLLGEANSGKTRLALEALRATLSDWPVLYWKSVSTKEDIPPFEFLKGEHLVLFIDDLQDYLSNISAATLDALVATLTQAALLVVLVVTCRIENQEQAQKGLSWLFDLLSNIPLPRFPTDTYASETRQIIDEFKRHGPIHIQDWDGTLGSLVLGLSKKHNQYLNLASSARTILQAMKLLKLAGVQAHTEQRLRATCARVFSVDDKALWREAVHLLVQMLFVTIQRDKKRGETILVIRKDAYFEQVVIDDPPLDLQLLIPDLQELREVFRDLKDILALFDLGTSFKELELPEEQLITIDEAIALDSNDPRDWKQIGYALTELNEREKATVAFTRVHDLLVAWKQKGISLISLKRYEEALAAFNYLDLDRHGIEYQFFDDLCSSKLSSQENERENAFSAVIMYLSNYEEALRNQAPNSDQNYSHTRDIPSISVFGRIVEVHKEHKKLLVSIDQVLALVADYDQLWFLRGLVLYLMERYEEAIAAFNSALTLHSNFPDAWYLKGLSYCMLMRYEEALDAFDHSWSLWSLLYLYTSSKYSAIKYYSFTFSNEVWATYLKGVVIEKVKGREQALVAFEYVMDMFMGYYGQHSPHPYLVSIDGTFKSVGDQEQQKPDEGVVAQNDGIVTSIDRLVALYPDNVLVWYYKGVMLYLIERYEDALVAFDRTLELDPHFIDAWRSKGYSFKVLGRNEEMVEAFSHAPDDTFQRFEEHSLSVWQRYLGAFDRARTLYPDGETAKWGKLYQSVQDGHIQDPEIVREIGLRFEALANDVEAAAKVDFDPVPAAQNLHKYADLLESQNEEEAAESWLMRRGSGKYGDPSAEDYTGGG